MAVTINASTSAGLVQTADTSGVLALQTAGTTAVSISASQVVTLTNPLAEASGGTGTSTGYYGFKNRIINGAMAIDQRNGGASVTPTNQQYTLDRWLGFVSGNAGAYSVAQSTTAPSGFYNSMLITSNANTTLGSTDYYVVAQRIEQNNLFDLGWGASGASSVTLSFKVYSSVAGTFNGYLYAYTATQQSYPFTYTVSSPNTWTSISVVIPGPTTGGLFSSPTSQGLVVGFTLGTGSSYATLSSPAWTSSFQAGLSGGDNFLATSGRVIYITGVQLEKGSTATSFDYRPYGTELALCQRYYVRWNASDAFSYFTSGLCYDNASAVVALANPVQMRAQPTWGAPSNCRLYDGNTASLVTSISVNRSSVLVSSGNFTTGSTSFVQSNPVVVSANNNSAAYLEVTAEL